MIRQRQHLAPACARHVHGRIGRAIVHHQHRHARHHRAHFLDDAAHRAFFVEGRNQDQQLLTARPPGGREMECAASSARNSLRASMRAVRANPPPLAQADAAGGPAPSVRPQHQKRQQRRGMPGFAKFGGLAAPFEHRNQMPEISREARRMAPAASMRKRKILDRRIQPIALHIIRLQRRRAARRVRIAMLHDRAGT